MAWRLRGKRRGVRSREGLAFLALESGFFYPAKLAVVIPVAFFDNHQDSGDSVIDRGPEFFGCCAVELQGLGLDRLAVAQAFNLLRQGLESSIQVTKSLVENNLRFSP